MLYPANEVWQLVLYHALPSWCAERVTKSVTAMGFADAAAAVAAIQIASIFEFGGAMLLGRVVTNTIAGELG